MRFEMRDILLRLGYHERSIGRVFNYYNHKHNLKIFDIRNATMDQAIDFLDCIPRNGVASLTNEIILAEMKEILKTTKS